MNTDKKAVERSIGVHLYLSVAQLSLFGDLGSRDSLLRHSSNQIKRTTTNGTNENFLRVIRAIRG
jgi:hypothetical protein